MEFEFATATRIVFGRGQAKRVPEEALKLARRALVVTGAHPESSAWLSQGLLDHGLLAETWSVAGEPTSKSVTEGAKRARALGCEVIIGVGGGSPIDAGKAIAALVTNGGDIEDYLEVVGRGKTIERRPAPFIAVPTTAGTGAEVTRNAVIRSEENRVKVSMRSPLMLPALAVIDPLLTVGMPREVTASTGLDALTQLIEPFTCVSPNPLIDGVCKEGMARAARSLRRAYFEGGDIDAREDMCISSLFGGLALANAKLGAVHGFAGPIGGMFDAPHGAVCARLLPLVIEANVRALSKRSKDDQALKRFDEVARILTGDEGATADDAVAWIRELCDDLAVPCLAAFGLERSNIKEIVEKSKQASSMKGNPVVLTDAELEVILERAI